ncbi:MAG: T9SS type A sorting domain-containing protein [Bacteroidota bacterium]|nr:T9SS type A sorting domain-containing protein [Bacteroidota bacterium]
MKTFIPILIFFPIIYSLFDINHINARTKINYDCDTISYMYDNAGNRVLRTITLPKKKSALVAKTDTSNTKKQMFEEKLGQQKILIYPNPTKGNLTVEIQGYDKEKNSALYLFNISGKILISQKTVNSNMSLDLSNYQAGDYILKIILGNKISTWKIIKE